MKPMTVKCHLCGVESRPVTPSSPAAPTLTALEKLHKEDGWGYYVGFYTMFTGNYTPLCPTCARPKKKSRARGGTDPTTGRKKAKGK